MKKALCAILAVLLCTLCFTPGVKAEEDYFPSVYVADDVWYKDRSQPLVKEGSNSYFLPAEAFDALPNVTVTVDAEARAARLSSPAGSFSIDTETGVSISPDGDTEYSVRSANGTVYLHVFQTCSMLGLSFELHTYLNGAQALRINDGSGVLNISTLVLMFAGRQETLSRLNGGVSNVRYTSTFTVSTVADLASAAAMAEGGSRFIMVLDADLVLFHESTEEFCRYMARLYSLDVPISLFAHTQNSDTMIHYLRQANLRLSRLFCRGTALCTATRSLTESDLELLSAAGFILTEFSFEEAE